MNLKNLSVSPETIQRPAMHFIFIEKIGPFQETAMKAWQELHEHLPELQKKHDIVAYTSIYRMEPKMIYRAGVGVAAAVTEDKLPSGMRYDYLEGGKYAKFVLQGSWAQLPEASGRVFEIMDEKKILMRNDYCMENYLNSPETTPEEQLRTEILIPIK